MLKKYRWYIWLALSLILASVTTYAIQLLIFRNPKDTFFYLFQDLAFVPVSVLLVTVVIDKLFRRREKRALLNKMNMVVGTFFSEMGNHLLKLTASFDCQASALTQLLGKEKNWSDTFIRDVKKHLGSHPFQLDVTGKGSLVGLKDYMVSRRDTLMRLLENPNLLEHETFTDLLWAVSHLTEELHLREDIGALSSRDAEHVANDVKRAYSSILYLWVDYIKHLRDDYPYMFSLAVRSNPFNPRASISVD